MIRTAAAPVASSSGTPRLAANIRERSHAAVAVGPRPQIVLDVVGIVVRVRGEEFVGGLEVVDRRTPAPTPSGR